MRFKVPDLGELQAHFRRKEQSDRTKYRSVTSSSLIQGWKNSTLQYQSPDRSALAEPVTLPEDELSDMTRIITNKKFRRRLNNLRKTFQAFETAPDSQAVTQKNKLRGLEDAIELLLLDAPRITGSDVCTIEQTRKTANELIQDIQRKLDQYQVANVKKGDKQIQWGWVGTSSQPPSQFHPQFTGGGSLTPKRELSQRSDQVPEDSQNSVYKEAAQGQGISDSDDDCIITMVIDKRDEGQKAIEEGMTLKDELLWHNISQHFDEDLLP